MDAVRDLIAGWIGGIVGLVVGYPADTIKVRQQSMNEKFFVAVENVMKHEGFFGFYKGLLTPLLSVGPSNAAFFIAYGACLRELQGETTSKERVDLQNPNWKTNVFVAGTVAGTAQVLVTCPSELLKTVFQVQAGAKEKRGPHRVSYNNTREALIGIWKTKGIKGFYKGLVPMFWRDVPITGVYIGIYEGLLPRGENPSIWKTVMAGGLAGVVSWVATIPFDVVKSRVQGDDAHNPKYKGMIDCFQKSLKKDGPGVFFSGTSLIVVRAFPSAAALFLTYEYSSRLLKYIF